MAKTLPFFKINVGSVVELTKDNIIESVEIDQDLESQLETEKTYKFMNMGKTTFIDQTMFVLVPYDKETREFFGEDIVYSYPLDEVRYLDISDYIFFKYAIKTRLMNAMTSFIEEPGFGMDEELEYEMDVARNCVKTLKILKELSEV